MRTQNLARQQRYNFLQQTFSVQGHPLQHAAATSPCHQCHREPTNPSQSTVKKQVYLKKRALRSAFMEQPEATDTLKWQSHFRSASGRQRLCFETALARPFQLPSMTFTGNLASSLPLKSEMVQNCLICTHFWWSVEIPSHSTNDAVCRLSSYPRIHWQGYGEKLVFLRLRICLLVLYLAWPQYHCILYKDSVRNMKDRNSFWKLIFLQWHKIHRDHKRTSIHFSLNGEIFLSHWLV